MLAACACGIESNVVGGSPGEVSEKTKEIQQLKHSSHQMLSNQKPPVTKYEVQFGIQRTFAEPGDSQGITEYHLSDTCIAGINGEQTS